jgi:hypothetical protein
MIIPDQESPPFRYPFGFILDLLSALLAILGEIDTRFSNPRGPDFSAT